MNGTTDDVVVVRSPTGVEVDAADAEELGDPVCQVGVDRAESDREGAPASSGVGEERSLGSREAGHELGSEAHQPVAW